MTDESNTPQVDLTTPSEGATSVGTPDSLLPNSPNSSQSGETPTPDSTPATSESETTDSTNGTAPTGADLPAPASSDEVPISTPSGDEANTSSPETSPVPAASTEGLPSPAAVGVVTDENAAAAYQSRWNQHTVANEPLTEADGSPIEPWKAETKKPIEVIEGEFEKLEKFLVKHASTWLAGESTADHAIRLIAEHLGIDLSAT